MTLSPLVLHQNAYHEETDIVELNRLINEELISKKQPKQETPDDSVLWQTQGSQYKEYALDRLVERRISEIIKNPFYKKFKSNKLEESDIFLLKKNKEFTKRLKEIVEIITSRITEGVMLYGNGRQHIYWE